MADVPNVSFWERGERQQVRRWLLVGGAALLFLVMLGLVAASPVVLYRLGVAGGVEWDEIGAIGDAYGAAATLLTAVSLVGITVSLLLGAKDSRTNRAQAIRTFHFELIRMQLEDPELLWANGWPRPEMRSDQERTTARVRQHLYANLWVYFYLMQYELRVLSEANLRALLVNELFNGEVGRQYWKSTGCTFEVMKGRRVKRFFQIMDEEYRNVVESGREPVPACGLPEVEPPPPPESSSRLPARGAVAAVVAGAAGLAAGATVLHRIRR
ncbi:DUF6082 family protein [Actinomadura sp. 6K520]|uniref:DUF6082 family protein n=1 Tax=Actinomadura sp. 6K520 TaxID=2530364 RepID=UPI001045FE48|nr:DUF6082 family protein [Actinomadura sp. 6K520]TDE33667.1 hypothetical protein E1289_11770 [Actinomadura sp. 6K520]